MFELSAGYFSQIYDFCRAEFRDQKNCIDKEAVEQVLGD